MTLYLYTLGSEFWSDPEIRSSVQQAHRAARRIEKGVEVVRERARLRSAMQAIERVARAGETSPDVLDGPQRSAALEALPRIGGTRLSFREPDEGGTGGFLLAIVPFAGGTVALDRVKPASTIARSRNAAAPADTLPDASAVAKSGRLASEIERSRRDGRPVPLGRSRHGEIALAMRQFLHRRPGIEPFELRFVYTLDGSTSGPILLAAIAERELPIVDASVCVGLNSARHFDLDPIVDLYLVRTADFERDRDASFRDQEELAYRRTDELLRRFEARSLGLRLYHTGLEPAVIGAYRAVIDRLLAGQSLLVTPVFFPSGPDQQPWW
jgi:hypothetical protein